MKTPGEQDCVYCVPTWPIPGQTSEAPRRWWAKDGGGRVFLFSHLPPIFYATLSTFRFCILVWARGYHLHPIFILCDIYQCLLLGQKHASGSEGTRILRILGLKEILENSE